MTPTKPARSWRPRAGDFTEVTPPSDLTVYEREREPVLYGPDGEPLGHPRVIGFRQPETKDA